MRVSEAEIADDYPVPQAGAACCAESRCGMHALQAPCICPAPPDYP